MEHNPDFPRGGLTKRRLTKSRCRDRVTDDSAVTSGAIVPVTWSQLEGTTWKRQILKGRFETWGLPTDLV
jgi:hypothetical protein